MQLYNIINDSLLSFSRIGVVSTSNMDTIYIHESTIKGILLRESVFITLWDTK